MTPATPDTSGDAVTTELPVTAASATTTAPSETREETRERLWRRPERLRPPRDIYQRRRESAAAALLVAGGALIWTQIGESITALLGR